MADQLAAAGSGETDLFLGQAIRTASQDKGLSLHVANDVLGVREEGHDAVTVVLIFVALQPASAQPLTVGLVNIQAEPAELQMTDALALHEAQHARINNELARRLSPAIYAAYGASDRTGATIQAALNRIIHSGGDAFDLATDHGRQGDQEAAASAVIESITQSELATLGR